MRIWACSVPLSLGWGLFVLPGCLWLMYIRRVLLLHWFLYGFHPAEWANLTFRTCSQHILMRKASIPGCCYSSSRKDLSLLASSERSQGSRRKERLLLRNFWGLRLIILNLLCKLEVITTRASYQLVYAFIYVADRVLHPSSNKPTSRIEDQGLREGWVS